jgi:hypothetical protein
MYTIEQLRAFQNNPQMMEHLINSPIDPNAILAYQMGGAMPEMPGVTMGQPGAAQAPVGNPLAAGGPGGSPQPSPPGDAWSGLAGAGSMLSAGAPKQTPSSPSPMLHYGDAPAAKAGDFSSRGPKTQTSSIESILAGFRK